jgi:hypothetical protein
MLGLDLTEQYPPLISDEIYNSRMAQMSVNAAGNILREIMKDRRDPSKSSSVLLYSTHLKALDSWYAGLPLYLCFRAPTPWWSGTVDPKNNDRQMTAIVCLSIPTDKTHTNYTCSSMFTLSSLVSSASYCNLLLAQLFTHHQHQTKRN